MLVGGGGSGLKSCFGTGSPEGHSSGEYKPTGAGGRGGDKNNGPDGAF